MVQKCRKMPVIYAVATLYSNRDRIYGFNYAPQLFEIDALKMDEKGKYRVTFNVKSLGDIENELGDLVGEHLYLSKKDTNTILVKRKTPLGDIVGKFVIDKQGIYAYSNKLYYSLIRLPIGGLLPPGTHLNNLLFSYLLLNNYLTLHASAISRNGEGSIIIAPSNTGKTLTTYNLILKGFSLVSDDITVVDLNNYILHSCPYAGTYEHNKLIVNDLSKKGILSFDKRIKCKWNLLIANTPLIPFFMTFKQEYDFIYKHFKFNLTSKIKNIFILQKGKADKIYQISSTHEKEIIAKKIKFLNSIEFTWWKDPIINALGYIHSQYSIENLMKVENFLINNLVKRCNVFVITAKDSSRFHEMITKNILLP